MAVCIAADRVLGSHTPMTRNPDLDSSGIRPAGRASRRSSRPPTRIRRALDARRSGAVAPAAAGRVLGNRGAEGAHRGGAARRALRAAGRRLRGELRGLRVRQDRQEAEDPAADEPGARLRPEEAGRAHRPHGRPVRQAALGGHRDARRHDAAVLSRRHRQSSGLHAAGARTRSAAAAARLRARGADAELRARADRRRLRRPASPGVLGPRLRAPLAAQGRVRADRAVDFRLARFLRGDQPRADSRSEPRQLLHEPRRPAPAVRAGADALHRAPAALVQPVDAHAVDRHAHRGARRRARGVLPRHLQPDRHQGRPVDERRVGAGPDRDAQSATTSPAASC